MINASRFKNVTSTTLEGILKANKLRISVVSNNEHFPVCLYDDAGNKFIIKNPGLTIEVLLKSLYGKDAQHVTEFLRVETNEAIQVLTRLYNVVNNPDIITRHNLSRMVHYKELISCFVTELESSQV